MLLVVQKPIEATATRERNQQWDDVLDSQTNPSINAAASLHHATFVSTVDLWNRIEGTILGIMCLLIACLKEDHPVCRPFLTFFHWLTLPDICAQFDKRSLEVDHCIPTHLLIYINRDLNIWLASVKGPPSTNIMLPMWE
mmetsp:Transcript_26458/g.57043  ORF Transcript_26458/g.57043 Transcript_26458/m.57043 type:complete len:140 (+) Transcript_26458:731-1150(+)